MDVGAPTLGQDAIPGNPAQLQTLCSLLTSTSHHVSDLRASLAQQSETQWAGHASSAYRDVLGQIGFDLDTLETSFDSVAQAINLFGSRLDNFQSTAAWLAKMISQYEDDVSMANNRVDTAFDGVARARAQRDVALPGPDQNAKQIDLDHAVLGLRNAEYAVESLENELRQLRAAAHENRQAYDDAVARTSRDIVADAEFARIRSAPHSHCNSEPQSLSQQLQSAEPPPVDTDPDDLDTILDFFDL
jgi:hypothetical protein